jgi:hypothetical protein
MSSHVFHFDLTSQFQIGSMVSEDTMLHSISCIMACIYVRTLGSFVPWRSLGESSGLDLVGHWRLAVLIDVCLSYKSEPCILAWIDITNMVATSISFFPSES